MALWLVRAGKYGEHEPRFFEDNRIYLTWGLDSNSLSDAVSYEDIKTLMQLHFPAAPARRLGNWTGQIWAFTLGMKPGDYVVVPRKSNGTLAIGEVKSGYTFNPDAEGKYGHFREVRWINTNVPRSAFDQDLLYSLGAIMTICKIKRNDAEKRVKALANGQAQNTRPTDTAFSPAPDAFDAEAAEIDLEQLSRDAIAKLIIQKFNDHGMARLVDAVLKAQGFTTHLSPAGPDKGIDILAAGGPFGFDHPRICVQVKSGNTPADRPEFTQLIGAMQSVNADQGLFVSWAGFKPTVLKEVPVQFFKVRLWNQEDLIAQLLANYSKIDEDIRLELPLKQIWTLSTAD